MMTVITPDGQAKAADGLAKAHCVSRRDIKDGASFTLAIVEKRIASAGPSAAGEAANSTFIPRQRTKEPTHSRRSTRDRPTPTAPTLSRATAQSANCQANRTGASGIP